MFSLEGKVALVTGATGGIGMSAAKGLAAAGAKVVLTGRKQDVLDGLKGEIASSVAIASDISDPEAAATLISQAEEQAGPLDILVNNAGLTRDGLSMRMKDEDWQIVLDTNLSASFRLIRESLKGMMRRKSGRVINISSIVGTTGNPGQANYAASKAGLIGLTKSLAAEVATRGITINAIAPGFIETPMTEVLPEKQIDQLLGVIPMGRLGQPDDITNGIIYLASDEAAYITGQTLHINGGMAMI